MRNSEVYVSNGEMYLVSTNEQIRHTIVHDISRANDGPNCMDFLKKYEGRKLRLNDDFVIIMQTTEEGEWILKSKLQLAYARQD